MLVYYLYLFFNVT